MLHELLLSLLGKTGSIIISQPDKFCIDPSLTFISQSQKTFLDRLVFLGYQFKKIDIFLQDVSKNQNLIYEKEFIEEKDKEIMDYNIREKIIEQEKSEFKFESLYLKALCYGIEEILDVYKERILEIEREYIKNRVFTISMINVNFSKYFGLFPELNNLIDIIIKDKIKGCKLIDLLIERKSAANEFVSEVYDHFIKGCYSLFFAQLSNWILFGRIEDYFKEFFIYQLEKNKSDIKETEEDYKLKKNLDNDWDFDFSIKYEYIPYSLITNKLAEKILFIGKTVWVLESTKSQNDLCSNLPDNNIISLVKQLEIYDNFNFHNVIEKLRAEYAAKLFELIMNKENLMDHLFKMKKYFLLGDGTFFQMFIEESKTLMQMPPKNNSSIEINNIALINTILRLNLDEKQIMKTFNFKIINNGFDFQQFNSLSSLKIIGDISHKNNSFLRFEPLTRINQPCVVWHSSKQIIEPGFRMSFTFRFKQVRINQISNFQHIFSLIIPDIKDLSSYKKNIPKCPSELSNYIAIKFGVENLNKNQKEKKNELASNYENSRSFIRIIYFSIDKNFPKNSKEKIIGEYFFNPEKFNFVEEDLFTVKIDYENEELKISFEDEKNELKALISKELIKVELKLGKILNLEIGKGYIGFMQEADNANFCIDLLNWRILGINSLNSDDNWNGLTIDYFIKWPLNLVISTNLLEKYSNIFRYLFPIRIIQLDLQRIWMNLNTKYKIQSNKKIGKIMILLRNQLSFVIENLWSYFHLDVLEVNWNKLIENLKIINDFDELRKALDNYLSSISKQIFFHVPTIVKSIFEICNHAKMFNNFLNRYEFLSDEDVLIKEIIIIRDKFKENFMKLLNLLSLLNKNYNSPFLFQLLLRLDYNNYFLNENNDKIN